MKRSNETKTIFLTFATRSEKERQKKMFLLDTNDLLFFFPEHYVRLALNESPSQNKQKTKNQKDEFATKFIQRFGIQETAGAFLDDGRPSSCQAAEIDHRDLHGLGQPLPGQASWLQPDQGPSDRVVRRAGPLGRHRGSDGNQGSGCSTETKK